MWAHNGSVQMCSLLGSNNQQGGEDASQTSDNSANNQSPQTRCCCKPVGAPAGAAPTEPSYCTPAYQSCGTVSGESVPPVHCTEHGRLWFGTFGCRRQHKVPPPGQM